MPTDMTRYPANWGSEIRPRILARAKGRCERCGALNGEIGHRDEWGRFHGCYACERGTGGGCGERAIRTTRRCGGRTRRRRGGGGGYRRGSRSFHSGVL